jgi:molecular chaperone DnaJ
MAKRDYYEVLGLHKGASDGDVKSAYRKLALKHHPDRNAGDAAAEERFKEASEAYEVLSDQDKRAQYDRFGHAGVEASFGRGGFQWSDFSHAGDFEDIFGDLFGSLFGGGRRSRRGSAGPPPGRDLKVKVELSMEEVATGVEKKISLNRLEGCTACQGSGAAPGSSRKSCPTCGGLGQVQQVSRSFFGQSVTVAACPACGGEGQTIEKPCSECGGEGRIRARSTLGVRIPAGVRSGNYIPLRGEGEVGRRGGARGDCLVFIEEKGHEHFTRDENDVVYQLPISFSQAVLGDEVQVPTLTGHAKMRIPPGTQSGRVFRLRGKGIPDVDGRGVGDQLVQVAVWTPQELEGRERELFEELAGLERKRAEREGKGFLDKMREAFGS